MGEVSITFGQWCTYNDTVLATWNQIKKCVYYSMVFNVRSKFILSFEKSMFNLCVYFIWWENDLIFWYISSAMIDITLFNLDTTADYIGIWLYAGLLLSLVSLTFPIFTVVSGYAVVFSPTVMNTLNFCKWDELYSCVI